MAVVGAPTLLGSLVTSRGGRGRLVVIVIALVNGNVTVIVAGVELCASGNIGGVS